MLLWCENADAFDAAVGGAVLPVVAVRWIAAGVRATRDRGDEQNGDERPMQEVQEKKLSADGKSAWIFCPEMHSCL